MSDNRIGILEMQALATKAAQERIRSEARAQALEEAAKVAETQTYVHDPGCRAHEDGRGPGPCECDVRAGIAKQLRALIPSEAPRVWRMEEIDAACCDVATKPADGTALCDRIRAALEGRKP